MPTPIQTRLFHQSHLLRHLQAQLIQEAMIKLCIIVEVLVEKRTKTNLLKRG